ncbi:PepSY domain-containing protein, partial [Pseudomonas viridiflava]|uniref:PepSY domain-containing protein n=1 Tax=Pseudomonas viridiflava TaxID=33069 RepID=UPI001F1565CD
MVCTVFLLLLALTGLPLVFHHEIDHLLGNEPQLAQMPADTPRLNLEQLVAKAQAHRPGEAMQYLAWDEDDQNGVIAIMAATAGTEPNLSHTFMLDARTGEAVE